MRIVVLFAVIISTALNTEAPAQTGEQLLQSVRSDALRQAESSSRIFPYSGSLYGLPGQTQSASIRQSALSAALGGILGSCKPVGTVDLTKLPANLQMNVSGILANSAVQVPNIPTSPGTTQSSSASQTSQSTQVANSQANVGLQNSSSAGTQSGANGSSSSPAAQSSAPQSTLPSVSKIWAPSSSH